MKKITGLNLTFALTLACILYVLAGYSKPERVGGSDKIVAVTPIKANRIKIVHEAGKDITDFDVTITDAAEIGNILGIYNSLKIREMSKPLDKERLVITFYHDDTEIAKWWVDSELTTACSAFGIGNHVIENKDFNYSYLEKLTRK